MSTGSEQQDFRNVPVLVGLSHKSASLEDRERIHFAETEIEPVLKRLAALEGIEETAILNTCNRLEIYASGDPEQIPERVRDFLAREFDDPPARIAEICYEKTGQEALEHLFAVTSGLESQMIGETEILGQAKQAYQTAQKLKVTGPLLNRIFQKSFQAAKWARSNSAIGRGQVSIGNVAVELATRIFGELESSRILTLGSGEVAERTLQALQSRGARSVTVSSRTFEHAAEAAERIGAAVVSFDRVTNDLSGFDIVIASTAAPEAVILAETVVSSMKKRPDEPLFLIDLAMPRDIEPKAADCDNVFLYVLEDLAQIVRENQHARENEIKSLREELSKRAYNLWKSFAAWNGLQ